MTKLTLEKIAELAGVSRSTASRVIRGQGSVSSKVKERVMKVVEDTGYQPNQAARSLAGRRTNVIGLVIAESAQSLFDDPYFPRLIQGVTQASNKLELMLTLFLFHDKQDEIRLSNQLIQNQIVDGLIVTGTHLDDPLVPKLIESDTPFVLVGRFDHPDVNYLDSDNVGGAETAVNHLAQLGYKRIATVTGDMNNRAAVDRFAGYQKALRQRGFTLRDELVAYGDYTEKSGFAAMAQLLPHKPDAVFVASDTMARGAARAIFEAGLDIPADIALVGFDDLFRSSSFDLKLTTIRQPIRQSGSMAVDLLLDILENRQQAARHVSLATELVIRESCGATMRMPSFAHER